MDRNLKMIQELTGVTVGVRGEKVFFNGPPEKVEDVRRLIVDIIDNLGKGRPVTSEEIHTLIQRVETLTAKVEKIQPKAAR